MNKTASAQHLILLRKISLYTFVLVLLWIVPTVFSAGAESKYLSVRELRESTPAEWKGTLIGGKKKFECTVDAPIVLPEVDRFPILRVTCQGELPGLEESGYYIENNDGRITRVKSIPDEAVEAVDIVDEISLHEESLDEETIQYAERKARSILQKIWNLNGTELERLGVYISRDQGSSFDYSSVSFCPVYNGIPYLTCPYSGYVIKNLASQPGNTVYAFWREDIDYDGASFCIPRVTGEYLPDVPLVPFEKIQNALREYIEKGYILRIHEIRLGYVCLNDPECPGENFYLTPAWIVCGVTNTEPNLPFYPEDYHMDSRYDSAFVFDAQTGKLFDPKARHKEEYDARILTWEDVR